MEPIHRAPATRMLTTNAILQAYYQDHGPFPPDLAAFLHGWRPDDEL